MNSIVIMGTPVNSENRGVLALCSSLAGLFADSDASAEIQLLLGHRKHETIRLRLRGTITSVHVFPVRLAFSSKLRDHLFCILFASLLYRLFPFAAFRDRLATLIPSISAIREANLVGDVRGGDSFSDIYGMRRFLWGFLLAWSVILVRGEIVQLPQTYGPFKNVFARMMARFLLRRSSTIIARDTESQHLAQELAGAKHHVLLSPDVAFSLTPIPPERIETSPSLSVCTPHPSEIIGVNVNGLMYNGGYTRNNAFQLQLKYPRFLVQLLIKLLEIQPGEIWLVPHTFGKPGSVESDPEASCAVRDALPSAIHERVRIVRPIYDQHEIKAIIGLCDFFVGSRMHACIAALSQGVPCVGVAYSMKFRGVFDSVGVAEWVVDGRSTSTDQALNQTLSLYRKRDEVRTNLLREAAGAKEKLAAIFKTLVPTPDRRTSPDQSGPASCENHHKNEHPTTLCQ